MGWNKESIKRQYDGVKGMAKNYGFTEEELGRPYLDKLSHQTKSPRIHRMTELAYWLGWLRGIKYVDEGLTPVELQEPFSPKESNTTEIERKWLFKNTDVPANVAIIERSDYWQAYLSVDPEVRIRKKLTEGSEEATYKLCIKSKGTLERIEVEKDLSEEEFSQLMKVGNLSLEDFISKKLIVYIVSGYELAFGIVDEGKSTSFCYGEIEFLSAEEAKEFETPSWFGKEVTDDNYYKMANYWKKTHD